MFKVNNKEARTTSTVSLFLSSSLTLCIQVSLLLTLNIFHILHDEKIAEIPALYWKKERKVSLTDCKLKCFSSRIFKPPPLNIGPSNLSFVCMYAQGVLTGFYSILSIDRSEPRFQSHTGDKIKKRSKTMEISTFFVNFRLNQIQNCSAQIKKMKDGIFRFQLKKQTLLPNVNKRC